MTPAQALRMSTTLFAEAKFHLDKAANAVERESYSHHMTAVYMLQGLAKGYLEVANETPSA